MSVDQRFQAIGNEGINATCRCSKASPYGPVFEALFTCAEHGEPITAAAAEPVPEPPKQEPTTGGPKNYCDDEANLNKEWVRVSFKFTMLNTTQPEPQSIQDYDHYKDSHSWQIK